MADNYTYTPGTGATAAGDLIGGVMYPRIKMTWGVDGASVDASASDPLPVVQTGTPGLPTGAATAAKQLADGHNVAINAALPAGTNAIGKLAANSGVDIGDVDVTSLPALATGTNIIGAVKRDVINYTSVNKYYANTGAVTDGIVWSPAGGKQVVITDLAMTTSAAATVTLQWDKTGGDEDVMAFDLAANGGVSMNLQTPIVCTEDDADLIITTSAGNVKIMISGYEL
jgi:hypothetical protein